MHSKPINRNWLFLYSILFVRHRRLHRATKWNSLIRFTSAARTNMYNGTWDESQLNTIGRNIDSPLSLSLTVAAATAAAKCKLRFGFNFIILVSIFESFSTVSPRSFKSKHYNKTLHGKWTSNHNKRFVICLIVTTECDDWKKTAFGQSMLIENR